MEKFIKMANEVIDQTDVKVVISQYL